MPKTGTTTLQRQLSANPERLERAGYEYPARWRQRDGPAHHELARRFLAPTHAAEIRQEVADYLRGAADRSVVISTEGVANVLVRDQPCADLRDALDEWCEVTQVVALMVLRRCDAFLHSTYLHQAKVGRPRREPDVDRFAEPRLAWVEALFRELAALRDAGPWSLEVLSYREREDSLSLMLSALGLAGVELEAPSSSRVGRRLGLKAQSLLAQPNEALRALGLRRWEAIELFDSGQFEFDDETYSYDVFGSELRDRIHQAALAVATEHGLAEYVEAFREASIPDVPKTTLDPGLVSDADAEKLLACVDEWRDSSGSDPDAAATGPAEGA